MSPENGRFRMKCKYFVVSAVLAFAGFSPHAKADTITLGTAGDFAVLANTTVTNTGPTTLTGDLGLYSGTSITGLTDITLNGTLHQTDTVAQDAQGDLSIAYSAAAALTPVTDLTGDLGGRTLTPGIYNFNSSALLTGTLTLNDDGDPNAQFVFQIGSTLTTASDASVVMTGGQDPNVFWQVGSSVTLGTGTAFEGNILADQSITLTTGATILDGRALAINGAVTLDTNTITAPSPVPEPGTMALFLIGGVLLGLPALGKRLRGHSR